ncbi:hypothetical protein HanIR_Chr07g0336861 [Helianthus annuus]|nr:hypothetical protein HanIR_Chr07g0336861 [Helianthus annuus]
MKINVLFQLLSGNVALNIKQDSKNKVRKPYKHVYLLLYLYEMISLCSRIMILISPLSPYLIITTYMCLLCLLR